MSLLTLLRDITDFQKQPNVCYTEGCNEPGAYLYLCTSENNVHTRTLCNACMSETRDKYCECGNGACPGGIIQCVLDTQGHEMSVKEARISAEQAFIKSYDDPEP